MTTKVLDLYAKRDSLAKKEQELEDEIFNPNKQRTRAEAEALGRTYQQVKDKRAKASIDAAVLYMQLSPEDKAVVDAKWRTTSEAKRKAKGSGIRGGK